MSVTLYFAGMPLALVALGTWKVYYERYGGKFGWGELVLGMACVGCWPILLMVILVLATIGALVWALIRVGGWLMEGVLRV